MKKIVLDDWLVAGFWKHVPNLNNSVETGVELKGVTPWIKGNVPGSVYKDLENAGLIEDPYFEQNSLKCEWVSNRWWIYKTKFFISEEDIGNDCNLVINGIDYTAQIYFNNVYLGKHEGMFTPFISDVKQYLREENELRVLLESPPEEVAQIGYTSETTTQKPRFTYKWDFSTRLVNVGICGEALLQFTHESIIEEEYIATDYDGKNGIVNASYIIKSKCNSDVVVVLKVKKDEVIFYDEQVIFLNKGDNLFQKQVLVQSPKLWYPNGYGEQELYRVEFFVYSKDKQIEYDKRVVEVGIRNIEYIQNENSPTDALPYTIKINGKRIYIKGTNLVPLDHMYGCVNTEKYKEIVRLAKDANINLFRIWGGGLIEKECLYDLCDENGIMIWQEFIQSSSGIDNIPSQNPHFLEMLEKTAIYAVKEKRNHTSLTYWSGGNELMEKDGTPCDFNNTNIKMLKGIVNELDPQRLMLPTSASGPYEFLDPSRKGQNHDVHGPWKYEGLETQYTLYNSSDSLLHSEFGVDGMSNLDSIKSCMSNENLVVTDMDKNYVWRHHGEWWDTYFRETEIFGNIDDLTLRQFINISQFIQAEGIRYAVESNRRRIFENSGSILWQLNEPWPNVSSTSIVDYYNKPKMCYFYLKNAFESVHVSLKYNKLAYIHGENFMASIYLSNDNAEISGKVWCNIFDDKGECMVTCKYDTQCNEDKTVLVEEIKWIVKNDIKYFKVVVSFESGQETSNNEYIFLIKNRDNKCYIPDVIM